MQYYEWSSLVEKLLSIKDETLGMNRFRLAGPIKHEKSFSL